MNVHNVELFWYCVKSSWLGQGEYSYPPYSLDLTPLEHKIDFFHNESGAHQNQILHTYRAT
jgi:hypothetical protein